MALFDSTLLFYHSGTAYSFTGGEYVSLASAAATTGSASTAINLGNARDLGIGSGQEIPQVVVSFSTGLTSSSATMTANIQFRGSTDSVNWTVYMETGAQLVGTASTGGAVALGNFYAGSGFTFPVPRRPPGVALPLYYDLNIAYGPAGNAGSITAGSILAGIVLASAESAGTMAQYPAGFTFPSGA